MKSIRFLSKLAIVLALAGLVAPLFAADAVTVRILTRWTGTDPYTPWLAEVKAEYQKLHPNVTIQDDSISDEAAFNNKLKIDIATGTPPDIYNIPSIAGLVDYAKSGVLLDVTPVFADKAWSAGLINGSAETYNLGNYGVKGTYAIPTGFSPEVVWYNTELFAKAGITKLPETMDEFYKAIDKLKAAKIIPWAVGGKDSWRLGHIFNNLAYRVVGVDYVKAIGGRKAKWTDATVLPAFSLMKDFMARGAFDKGFMGMSYDDEKAGFFAGKYAMTVNGTWFMGDIKASELNGKIKFFAFPYFADKAKFKGDSVVFPGALMMSGKKKGAEKDAAIDFIKFMTNKDNTDKLVADYSIIGGRKDTDLSSTKIEPLFKQVMSYLGTVSNPGGDFGDYDQNLAMLEKGRSILQGLMVKDSPETAAKNFQAVVDTYEKSKK